MKRLLILLITLSLSLSFIYSLPESSHPYQNGIDKTQSYTSKGAYKLEVTFSKKTEVEKNHDYIILLDAQKEVIGKYTGKELAGQTIIVTGDTVYIRLVTDDSKVAYGYKVVSIRAIFSRDYEKPVYYDYSKCENLTNEDLKEALYNLIKNHKSLGYTLARKKMFGEIDNENGYVRCVYTGKWVKTTSIPNPNIMNTEHTWPKSLGAGSEPAKSDLHHLFPTDSETNSRRSSYPFGIVVEIKWGKGGSYLGKDKDHRTVFMPREDHRGNVARAIFYFAIRYKKHVPDYEEKVLKKWNHEDPVDEKEKQRNDKISCYQKNRNPFIDHPEYVDRIDDF